MAFRRLSVDDAAAAVQDVLEAQLEQPLLGRDSVRWALRRRWRLRRVAAGLKEKFEEQDVESQEDGPIIRFLRWILENPEVVAAFIAMIMQLFAPVPASQGVAA